MDAFELSQLIERREESARFYLEFLRVPALSMGIFQLPAGGTDHQQPHTEDEVYYIVGGKAMIRVADEDRPVQPGSVVFVAAKVPHHFHTITEDLTGFAFFAPAEHSRA